MAKKAQKVPQEEVNRVSSKSGQSVSPVRAGESPSFGSNKPVMTHGKKPIDDAPPEIDDGTTDPAE